MPAAYVLGSPIAHSLSPVLHSAAYAELGLSEWTYAAAEVDEAGLPGFVAALSDQVRGLSLTMPLKQVAFDVAESVTDRARQAHAINTLVRTESGWAGDNTDIAGIVAALSTDLGEAQHWVMEDSAVADAVADTAVVLGAGATARSTLIALAQLGVCRVRVAARNPERARQAVGPLAAELSVDLTIVPIGAWPAEPTGYVVSTLPDGGADAAVAALADGGHRLSGVRLLDCVYAHWPTPLALAAGDAGARVVGGLDMLVHQAVEQVELMTGRRPDWQLMLAAGQAAMAAR